MTQKITPTEMRAIADGRAILKTDHARLYAAHDHFYLVGKSGTHSLRAASTSLDRLNKHWDAFTRHPANR
jgi:hypothetical protein